MSYRDELVRCAACGNQFVFTVREQRHRAAQGMPSEAPAFCQECRGADVRLAEGVEEPDAVVDGEPSASPVQAAGEVERRSEPSPKPRRSGDGKRGREGQRSGGTRRAGGDSRSARGGGGRPGGRLRRQDPPAQTEIRVRHLGTVKWFDDERGFGFIAQEDGEELFVHSTAILVEGVPPLIQGQQVEYEIARTARGPQAVDVVPLG